MRGATSKGVRSRATAIDHVGVLVHDLPAAIAYFVEKLGLDLISQQEIASAGVQVAYLGGDRGALLQLLQPIQDSPLSRQLKERGEGVHHICLATNSIVELVRQMPGEGTPTVVQGGRGMRTCFLEQRPFGLVIELAEPESLANDGLGDITVNPILGSGR